MQLSYNDIFLFGYIKEKINREIEKIYEDIRMDKNIKGELNVRLVFEPSGDKSRILIKRSKVSSKFTPKKTDNKKREGKT